MRNSNRKHGFLLIEAMMALALAMALVVGITQLLVIVARQRSLQRQYSVARQEVGNLMEELALRSWADTTAEAVTSIGLSDACATCLPDANLSVSVAEEDAATRRITLQIEWQAAAQRASESVRLVGWKFLAKETRP